MNQQAVELLRAVVKDADLYHGKLGASTLYDIKTYLESVKAMNVERDDVAKAEILRECREQAGKGNPVEAVKRFRSLTGCGLREAYGAITGRAL